MALITIADTLHNSQGDYATSGTLSFTLSGWYVAADGHIIVPKAETVNVNTNATPFSIQLESTEDGSPASRSYTCAFSGVIETVQVDITLGTFTLPPSPTTRELSDLLLAGIAISPATTLVFVDLEIPSGTINGTNKTFTIGATPVSGSVMLYWNSLLQRPTVDYSMSGATITMINAPVSGDYLLATYRKTV